MNRFFMNLAAALLLALSLEAGDALSSAHLTSLTPAAGVKRVKIKKIILELPVTKLPKESNTTLTLTALYDDNSTEDVTGKAEWIITPKDAVTINGRTLTAKHDTSVTIQAELNATRSNPVTLEIYWEVNGHRLPPEPDTKINNATLLGVDVNHNGVRDDVERYIYKTYSHPIERAAFMQLAKALQYRMGHADEAWKYRQPTSDAVTCFSYWEDPSPSSYPIRIDNYKAPFNELKPIQYNTELRKTDNEEYQKALSGGVIEDNGLEPEEWIQKCDFNATELMKDHQ